MNLKELLEDLNIQTMGQTFGMLRAKNAEIFIHSDCGSSYIPIETRKEFVILEDVGNKTQLLHPYGSSILYEIHKLIKE